MSFERLHEARLLHLDADHRVRFVEDHSRPALKGQFVVVALARVVERAAVLERFGRRWVGVRGGETLDVLAYREHMRVLAHVFLAGMVERDGSAHHQNLALEENILWAHGLDAGDERVGLRLRHLRDLDVLRAGDGGGCSLPCRWDGWWWHR